MRGPLAMVTSSMYQPSRCVVALLVTRNLRPMVLPM
ncbi:MAG: hypothetical protein BWY06_01865 [Candidatus Latescibacteria bacterium ADurb.Bin168]|nr:MAG: hypothetical protein BWY06_01865 [Candidatus Latescibacteria bacterium ADurb.Bin168]